MVAQLPSCPLAEKQLESWTMYATTVFQMLINGQQTLAPEKRVTAETGPTNMATLCLEACFGNKQTNKQQDRNQCVGG